MSRCGRTQNLEAVVHGDVAPSVAIDLRRHAQQCALCRHELNWLESESALFKQRAGRDEVARLWQGVADRRGLEQERPWVRMMMAAAAAALLMMFAGRITPVPTGVSPVGEEQLASEGLMSPMLDFGDAEPCSRLPTGMGFQCSQPVPASFLAAR